MQEFTTVSSSSYDPSALAAKLNDKSAEGWSVVSIVSTGGDVTAFLSRESSGRPAAEPESTAPIGTSTADTSSSSTGSFQTSEALASYEPMVPEHVEPAPAAAAEPAGWAVAPESSSSGSSSFGSSSGSSLGSSTSSPSLPTVDPAPTTSYTPAPAAATYTPAPAAAATPAVPAGWYADPAGRFELRYWDGSTWTEHMSRAGQQFTDPPVA